MASDHFTVEELASWLNKLGNLMEEDCADIHHKVNKIENWMSEGQPQIAAHLPDVTDVIVGDITTEEETYQLSHPPQERNSIGIIKWQRLQPNVIRKGRKHDERAESWELEFIRLLNTEDIIAKPNGSEVFLRTHRR